MKIICNVKFCKKNLIKLFYFLLVLQGLPLSDERRQEQRHSSVYTSSWRFATQRRFAFVRLIVWAKSWSCLCPDHLLQSRKRVCLVRPWSQSDTRPFHLVLYLSGWPVGAVLAQACHAATAAIHLFYRKYFGN